MSPRPGLAELRKRALIGATLKEISDRGSLEVTVAQIATSAGVSSALAHHYFGGKEDLMLATMRHLLREFGEVIVAGLRQAHDPRARITAIIRGSFGPEQFHSATISAWLTFYAKALSSEGAARLLSVYQRRLQSNLTHALRGMIGPDEAARVAAGISALIDGVYLHEALRGRRTTPESAIGLIEDYVECQIGRYTR